MNLFDRLLNLYMERFINRTDIWGRQWISADRTASGYACQSPDMDTKGGRFVYEPVTPELVRSHFIGHVSCAWSATDQNRCSRWLCLDSDAEDGQLDRLESALRSWGVNVIREGRRPGRAGHLWILFDAPLPAELLIVLGDAMMQLAGVSGLERFPKTATGISLVRGPLGINLKPEASLARGLFDVAQPTLKAQLEWLAQQPLNKASDAIREATKLQAKATAKERRQRSHKACGGSGRQSNRMDWVQYADQHGFKDSGDYRHGPCPSCRRNGNDRTGNNMWVHSGGAVGCFRGCSYWDIHRAAG